MAWDHYIKYGINEGRKVNNYKVELSTAPIRVTSITLEESPSGYEKHREYFTSMHEPLVIRAIRKMRTLIH